MAPASKGHGPRPGGQRVLLRPRGSVRGVHSRAHALAGGERDRQGAPSQGGRAVLAAVAQPLGDNRGDGARILGVADHPEGVVGGGRIRGGQPPEVPAVGGVLRDEELRHGLHLVRGQRPWVETGAGTRGRDAARGLGAVRLGRWKGRQHGRRSSRVHPLS